MTTQKPKSKKSDDKILLWLIVAAGAVFVITKFLIWVLAIVLIAFGIFVVLYMQSTKFRAAVKARISKLLIRLKLRKADKENPHVKD